jgi:spermidine/putrescine transport system substrate-binding protein
VKNFTKYFILFVIVLICTVEFTGCTTNGDISNKNNKSDIKYTETLKVYNAGEYIDKTTIEDFEKEFAIKIDYSEFESNEDMYAEVSRNPNAYDVLVPSDYTIDRLIQEGMLAKLDKAKVPNIDNIAEEYLNLSYDPDNEYVVPYMVGTLGILYNKKRLSDTIDSWNVLFDVKHSGKILMLDSERDMIGATLKMLGFSLNSNNDAELAKAKEKLLAIRSIISDYNESEDIRDRMVAGEGVLGVVYSGDAKTAIDRNPDLAYVIPQEGSNKWVDGFVIMKNTQHLEAAYKFINFMCRPNIAVRNMAKIGYTSPVSGAWAEFSGNKIMFPTVEELDRCESFIYDKEATQKYSNLWEGVRRLW